MCQATLVQRERMKERERKRQNDNDEKRRSRNTHTLIVERERAQERNIINLFKHGEIIMKEKQISFIHCDFIVCKHGRLFVVLTAKYNNTRNRFYFVSFFRCDRICEIFVRILADCAEIWCVRVDIYIYVYSSGALFIDI